jgi:hypothetical protein
MLLACCEDPDLEFTVQDQLADGDKVINPIWML